MKTKIIYISGNEVFDMADIRAAFDEVRNTLNLGPDTVMFGVPVDNDDAFENTSETTSTAPTTDFINDVPTPPVAQNVAQEIENTVTIPDETVQVDTPVKKTTTRRGRSKKIEIEETNVDAPLPQEPSADDAQKIIPILSVLGGKSEPDSDNAPVNTDIAEDDNVDTEEIQDIDINAEFGIAAADGTTDDTHAAIVDMITEDAPEAPIEKTLEQLLESMTPLREDSTEDIMSHMNEDFDDAADVTEEPSSSTPENDADATLEKLAAEFAENQDKISGPEKAETHSKIGKLKNILPFKKAKREETGIMGDLFGWAGIAANDDDFSIPGFFTKAASKK